MNPCRGILVRARYCYHNRIMILLWRLDNVEQQQNTTQALSDEGSPTLLRRQVQIHFISLQLFGGGGLESQSQLRVE